HAYAEENNTTNESVSVEPSSSAAIPQSSNATQNTGSNTENPVVNWLTLSNDTNKPIHDSKTVPVPNNYNLPINTTSLKIQTNSTINTNNTSLKIQTKSTINTNNTSLTIQTNSTSFASINSTSLSDDSKITIYPIAHLNSTTQCNP